MLSFSRLVPVALLSAVTALAQQGDRKGEIQRQPPAHIQVPPSPVLSLEEGMKTFKVAPGFHLELVAAEPMVADPVAIAFGADGKLWVVEMRGYMPNIDGKGEDAPIGSIAVLEDTDGDGRMDKRTVFLDGLVMPRAIMLVENGALIAEPTHLWLWRDTNGDGVADQKTEIASDYGNTSNPEHNANGLMWALDNWIYNAKFNVRYRYEGNGKFSRGETIPRGQWGITQDDVGRIYYNTNSDPLRADLLPSEYLSRNPNFTAAGTNVQLVPANLRIWPSRVTTGVNRGYQTLNDEGKITSMTAACSPVIYRGALYGQEFLGNAFVCEPSANLVKRIALDERDGTVKGRNVSQGTEFITSTDERFRPVNLVNGPDGALYLVDMYRGVLQHKTFVTSYLRQQVEERNLEQPVNKGRIYRIAPDGAPHGNFKTTLAQASTADLVKQLGDANGWTRDTAQRLLIEKREASAVPALVGFAAAAENPLGRLHALWTLEGVGRLDRTVVLKALADADVRVTTAGLRLAERFFAPTADREIVDRVLALVARTEPAIRLQLALSLGQLRSPAGDAALVKLILAAPTQPFLSDAVVSGVGGREENFITELMVASKGTTVTPSLTVAQATGAVLKSGEAPRIERVLALLADSNAPAWIRPAVLEGVQKFLPRSPDGAAVAAKLPAEPKALMTVAESGTPAEKALATKLLASLRWPGKAGMSTVKVAELTVQEKALFEKGRAQFAVLCAACHQPAGQGMPGLAPALINSRWLLGDDRVLARLVLCGKAEGNLIMPPMKILDDEAIAGVLTFVRRSWGHEAAAVKPAVVTEARQAVAGKDDAWTTASLETLAAELKAK